MVEVGLLLVGLIFGFIAGRNSVGGEKIFSKLSKEINIAKNSTIKEGHMKPQYHGFHDGFNALNQCTECSIIGLYEDLHTASPCPYCGGKTKGTKPGKYMLVDNEYQWILKK